MFCCFTTNCCFSWPPSGNKAITPTFWNSQWSSLRQSYRGLVSKETVVLRRWGSDTRKFGLSTPLINQIFVYDSLNSSCLASALVLVPAWDRGQVCQSSKCGQSLCWSSIRDQYPQDIVKLAGLKNDVNSMRSVLSNISKRTAFLHQGVTNWGFRKLVRYNFETWYGTVVVKTNYM